MSEGAEEEDEGDHDPHLMKRQKRNHVEKKDLEDHDHQETHNTWEDIAKGAILIEGSTGN